MRQQIDGAAKAHIMDTFDKYQGEHLRLMTSVFLVSVWIKPGCWVH